MATKAKPCRADFNADKTVDAKDLLSLLGRFAAENQKIIHGTLKGKHPVYKKLTAKRSMCTGDLTGDGALDVLDLLELLKLFGSTYKNIACGKC